MLYADWEVRRHRTLWLSMYGHQFMIYNSVLEGACCVAQSLHHFPHACYKRDVKDSVVNVKSLNSWPYMHIGGGTSADESQYSSYHAIKAFQWD